MEPPSVARGRSVRGDKALRSAAGTVEYEFRMFLVGITALDRAPTWEEQNLVLEALLVHARNLRDFFQVHGRSDDILARDFVVQMPSTSMPYLRSRSCRRRLNRLLAHLSYSRSRLSRDWNICALRDEISGAMRAFLSRVARDNPGRLFWFGDLPGILEVSGPP